ncbi:MAG: EAL domain-containing protein [Burkholderiaceae bacterium]
MRSRVAHLASSRWLRRVIGALSTLLVLSLSALFVMNGEPGTLVVFAVHSVSGGLLFVVVLIWLLATRLALAQSKTHAQGWKLAIDTLATGVAVYDANDRLISCNDAYRNLYPEVAPMLVRGVRYADILAKYYAQAPAEMTRGRSIEHCVRIALESRRRAESIDVAQLRGRWILSTDCRTAGGGVISFRQDVTSQGVVEHELRKRQRLVDDMADLTYDWFWRSDAEGRIIELSGSIEATLQLPPETIIGLRMQELPGLVVSDALLAEYARRREARLPLPWFVIEMARGGDSERVWLSVTGKPLTDEAGRFLGYYGAARDVTARESAARALRESEERFRALTLLVSEWYWETDAAGLLTVIEGDTGHEAAAIRRLTGLGLMAVANSSRSAPLTEALVRRQSFRAVKVQLRDPEGDAPTDYDLSGEPVFRDGQFIGFRGLAANVTEREGLIRSISESEARFRALTELSSDWYWETDVEMRFSVVRRGAGRSYVPDAECLLGLRRWELAGELVQPASWDEHKAQLAACQPFRDLLVRRSHADGSTTYELSSGDPIFDAHGRFGGYRGVGKDITEQIRSQERIRRLTVLDPLTQLANRQTFDELASRQLAQAWSAGRKSALLFVDLDNFRLLNNGYGHRVGDHMLQLTAERMRAVIPEPNLIGRRGGDEMVVLLGDVANREAAIQVARHLIESISQPTRVFGMEVAVTPSVGIGCFPDDGIDLDSLLNAADAAMYEAKDRGRQTYALFTPSVARRVDLRLRLEQRLRKAVESRDFKLYYQPLIALGDGKLVGAEALIRWRDAEMGDISPAEFIPIAEESGLIVGLGEWVIQEVCRARQVWRGLGLDVPPIALNMSGVELKQLGCVERLTNVLRAYGISPDEIEVEVTETGLLDTSTVSREHLVQLRNAGIRLALDDFGVGFSSLAHLRDLPIHRLKIDRSFTVECMRDARTLTIVKAVIEMARSLGLTVTAEGIETQAQQTWMQHLGCDSAQGYLFSRPLPADDFLKLFLDRRGVGREKSLMH